MTTYIMRRLTQGIVVIILVTILVFLAMHLLPGDPVLMFISQDKYAAITPQELQVIRHQYGLDKPVVVQYFDWVDGVLHGDLGNSILQQEPVMKLIRQRLPVSLYLGILTFLVFNILGIPAGVICAIRRGKWLDNVITVLANVGLTMPVFWLGILLIYLFGLYLRWLPIYGYTSPFSNFWLSTKQAIMPVICLSVFPIASTARQTRSSMLEVMRQDYIRTAWSKGLRERAVILRHAMKNGLIPVVTLTGLGVASIIGGQVLVEIVFNIPGMGRLAVNAILGHDFMIVQGEVLLVAIAIVMANLAVDLSYGWFDPRVRYE